MDTVTLHTTDPARALDMFSAPTKNWFLGAFDAPTAAQAGAWQAIADDNHVVVVAPTGSGKTLAAFLWAIDQISSRATEPESPQDRCKVLYISPLKALAADVERNLSSPLYGIEQASARLSVASQPIEVGTRTGDTPPAERRRFAKTPPDILITTPESLYLMLTSGARAGLRGVETVIIDEIHYVAGTKRGAHLAISLERLDELLPKPARRVGLSATVEPVSAVAEFLAGGRPLSEGGRNVVVVQPTVEKVFDITVEVPVADLADPGAPSQAGDAAFTPAQRASVWPHVEERIVDLITQNTSTLVFTNARRGAERLTARLNEIWATRLGEDLSPEGERYAARIQAQSGTSSGALPLLARAHHGSMSRTERTRTETDLKQGRLPCVVSTSSLELGIDMGSIDLVAQVGPPPSVASGLQRVGRAGHQVGAVSHGVLFPLHRGDLVPTAVIAHRMRTAQIEPFHRVANPLDVLAQQIVAMLAVDDWALSDLAQLLRRANPFAQLGEGSLTAVLDMLAGRYPSEDFGELRARIIWDRVSNVLSGRPGALRLATTSGGTIPDRGLFGVFLADQALSSQSGPSADGAPAGTEPPVRGGKRVGELDEEMVYESRVGDVFTLGSSTWRIEDITADRVLVTPAPGVPGRLPFWKGDSLGRPVALGRAMGKWLRVGAPKRHEDEIWQGLTPSAQTNLHDYLTQQEESTGVLPTDKTIVVERFRDELGDWRVVIHTPFGARVHAPWALVIGERIRTRFGIDAAAMHSDDGIVLRLPSSNLEFDDLDPQTNPSGNDLELTELFMDPSSVPEAVRTQVSDSSLFGARFREASARALLLPRLRPDKRQPLWQQRHRASQLLGVAANFPDFPMVLEAVRECLQDDFDVPALTQLMTEIDSGAITVVEVTTPTASPFAQSLLFGYTAQFIYDGDAPLAERRAAALTLDPNLLAELLGTQGAADIADLLDQDAIVATGDELAYLTPNRALRSAEALWDFMKRWGPATERELQLRLDPQAEGDAATWLASLEQSRRVIKVRLAGVSPQDSWQWIVIDDAARLRDALGVALPPGVPAAFTAAVPDPLGDLIRRHARTHVPFSARSVAQRFGIGIAVAQQALTALVNAGTLTTGRLLPTELGGVGHEFCDLEVMRMLRRRSLAALRAEVEPVETTTLAPFLASWHGLGQHRGVVGTLRAIEQLAGTVLPLSALESQILPARVSNYSPAMLDELTASGEVTWAGHRAIPGPRGGKDGMISLHLADSAPASLPIPPDILEDSAFTADHLAVYELLRAGALFAPRIGQLTNLAATRVTAVLWDLTWAGYLTNDTMAPLRALLGSKGSAPASRAPARARPMRSLSLPGRTAARAPLAEPTAVGRWATHHDVEADHGMRIHVLASALLDRYGVVTRTVNASEDLQGSFNDVYKILAAAETTGQVRRGYFIEHLGGAQFAAPGTVDLLRTVDQDRRAAAERGEFTVICVAAMDPANPYGGALPWPQTIPQQAATMPRPGRKVGGTVVIVNGELAVYVEKGGRSVLTFTEDLAALTAGFQNLIKQVDSHSLPPLSIQKINGHEALGLLRQVPSNPVIDAMTASKMTITPQGIRYRPLAGSQYRRTRA